MGLAEMSIALGLLCAADLDGVTHRSEDVAFGDGLILGTVYIQCSWCLYCFQRKLGSTSLEKWLCR